MSPKIQYVVLNDEGDILSTITTSLCMMIAEKIAEMIKKVNISPYSLRHNFHWIMWGIFGSLSNYNSRHQGNFHLSAFCLVCWVIGLSVCPFRGDYLIYAMKAKFNHGHGDVYRRCIETSYQIIPYMIMKLW